MPGVFLNLDRDSTFANNSDEYVASQKAVKTALDLKASKEELQSHADDETLHLPDVEEAEGKVLKVVSGVPTWSFILEFRDHTAE